MKTLARLGFPSSQRVDDRFERLPRRCHVVAVRDSDSDQVELFTFNDVEAVRITYHSACSEDMMLAYDQLVEIYDSEWLTGVKKEFEPLDATGLRHLRLYLDDGPCYEFLCRSAGHTQNA